MLRTVLQAKLHRPRITEANLKYMGSITLDREILEKSGIKPHEKVQIVDINNGERFETYVIAGDNDSRTVCLNGAAARLVQPGDEIIVMSYVQIENEKIKDWEPRIVLFDEDNNIYEKSR